MGEIRNYGLPATAICPGCGTMVTLPPEPIFPDSPPSICATCETEVPDYRRGAYEPSASLPYTPPSRPQPAPVGPAPVTPTPDEPKRVSRAGLFRSLGGVLAERGESIVEDAKQRLGEVADI